MMKTKLHSFNNTFRYRDIGCIFLIQELLKKDMLNIYHLIKILGDACKTFPQVGVKSLGSDLPSGLLSGGGGETLMMAKGRTYGEVAQVRRARVSH